jgi:hypothetical protein
MRHIRRVTAILSVAAVVLMAAGLSAQAKPSFAGEWKKVASAGQGVPGADLIITQNATSITVEDVRARQVSKATWAANKLVVTTTTAAGEEKRTFSMEGADLVVETSAPTRNGGAPTITKATYQKYERGHGG